MKLPNVKKPCRDCPYRRDSQKGWLGEERMAELLEANSFVCHKNKSLQCAGHMLVKGDENQFVSLAKRLDMPLNLSGRELVFDSKEECIEHHRNV